MTYAGYILGFPTDTPESIARDIEIIKKELPIDILEFFFLTPLPGSEDHKKLHLQRASPMDPDMNKYDLEHACTGASADVEGRRGRQVYRDAWARYYTDEHVETIMRRAVASGHQPQQDRSTALIDVLGRGADRGRASAAIRLRAPQGPHPAPLRHADRQSADVLSVARVRFRCRRLRQWLALAHALSRHHEARSTPIRTPALIRTWR